MKENKGALSATLKAHYDEAYEAEKKNAVLRHALSRTAINDACYAPESRMGVEPVFSIDIKTMPVCNQKQSGRCWIFAGLNVLREIVGKKLGITNFELSQNYVAMWDKIEKANFAMESIISLLDRPSTDRVFMHILNEPVSDGGQWDMFVNLVKKYGLLPKSAFPETFQSEHTRQIDWLINSHIRKFAFEAKSLGDASKAETLKEEYLERIYDLCVSSFGVPPKTFAFEYEAKDGYHCEEGLTALSFVEKYLGDVLDDYQSLIHSPTADKPYGRNFTVDYLGNVVEGKIINHLNITMDRMEELIIAQLSHDEPVWFGSDVSFYRDQAGIAWDDTAIDYLSALGFVPEFEKGAMLDYRASMMNHAMVITGVDIKNGKPTKWKIENSWGSEPGSKGYFVMPDSWFRKFVYQAVISKKYLSEAEIEATKGEPIHLDPWDPMGTLA